METARPNPASRRRPENLTRVLAWTFTCNRISQRRPRKRGHNECSEKRPVFQKFGPVLRTKKSLRPQAVQVIDVPDFEHPQTPSPAQPPSGSPLPLNALLYQIWPFVKGRTDSSALQQLGLVRQLDVLTAPASGQRRRSGMIHVLLRPIRRLQAEPARILQVPFVVRMHRAERFGRVLCAMS